MPQLPPTETNLYKIVTAINQVSRGNLDCTGTVTLTANAASTAVTALTCAPTSNVFLFPRTANAAAAVATTYVTSANIAKQQFTITHANTATTDRTFSWVVLG